MKHDDEDAAALARDYDVVVAGSGAAGLTTAITAAVHGLRVLVVEKTDQFGGSTAVSGGTVWVPGNTAMQAVGLSDSAVQAREYLRHSIGPGADDALLDAFLRNAPAMLAFIHQHTPVRLQARASAPDYYPELPGWMPGGRAMDPAPYDARALGEWFSLLRRPLHSFLVLGGMMVNRADIGHLMGMWRSGTAFVESLRLLGRYAADRLRYPRGTRLVLGNALAAGLLRAALDAGVTLVRNTRALSLHSAKGRVGGLTVEHATRRYTVHARCGVVLACGGFAADAGLRSQHIFSGHHVSMAPAGNIGDAITIAAAVGGHCAEGNSSNAFLTPVSTLHDSEGGVTHYPHLLMDRAKPGVIAVDHTGSRFANEAQCYHEFGRAMHRGRDGQPIETAWLVADARALRQYGLGLVRPGRLWPRRRFLARGYLLRARTLRGLAARMGVPEGALERTVEHHNDFAVSGHDADFHKGESPYDRYLGDAAQRPNPCLAPIVSPPFYAVKIHPGDIGSSRGLRTDPHARVLNAQSEPIGGLYCCGNDMNSIMAGSYPGAGITLGPAMTFGFIAARAMMDEQR